MDDEFDEFEGMTEDEINAEADREMRLYAEWYGRLSLPQQIAHRRRIALDNCRSARRLIRLPNCPAIIIETTRERLKAAQVRLLKVRTWRATGVQPGTA